MALSDVIISERGGGRPVAVALAGLSANWEISRAGLLTGNADVDELQALGLPFDLRGYWCRYEHPTAGVWGGVITSVGRTADGFAGITAETFHVLLRKRFSIPSNARAQRPQPASAGSLFKRALSDASHRGPTFLTAGEIEEGGGGLQVEWARADIYQDIIPQLTDDIGYEWDVSANRVVTFGKKLGRDKTGSVRLVGGIHLSDYTITDDLQLVSNVLTGNATITRRRRGKNYTIPTSATAQDQASVDRFGPLEADEDFGQVIDGGSIRTVLEGKLADAANPAASFDGTLVDVDHIWGNFAAGDTVRLDLGRAGVKADLRVMVRAVNVDQGTLAISGDATVVP